MLHQLYKTVVVTDVIAAEFGEPLPKWIEIRKITNTAYQRLLEGTLDAGEASAIALAMETQGALLVVDDLKARKEASRLGLKMTGTMGILYRAKQAGIVPLLAPLLQNIEQAGFRISSAIVEELLRKSGEATRH
jgi:predicted nucleic acid-binding protein